MSDLDRRKELRGSLRFTMVFTAVNGLLVLMSVVRMALGGMGTEPRATVAVFAVIAITTLIGVARIRTLKRELDQLG